VTTDRILVLIPCYNCENQVGRVLGQFAGDAGHVVEQVLVLDNQSRDGTIQAARDHASSVRGARVVVGRNKDNYNLGGSHKAAFAYAREQGFTHVVTLHGDDQGRIDDLLPILAAGRHRTHDACLGSRFGKGARLENYSRFRIFGNHVFNALFSAGAMTRITDLGSGLNIFGERVFNDPHVHHWSDDLRFNVYLLLGMIEQKMRIEYFPISWREDDQVSNVKMTSQALKTLDILRDYTLQRKHFMTADHRAVPHQRYAFDVVG
jgi:dolichol-phosphate mannosyltransferase